MYQKCILQYYILHTRSYAHRKCNRFEIDVLLEQIELGNLFLEFFGHLQSKLSLWILPKKGPSIIVRRGKKHIKVLSEKAYFIMAGGTAALLLAYFCTRILLSLFDT